MMSLFKNNEKPSLEKQYYKLLQDSRMAHRAGDLKKYSSLVAEANRLLVKMFSQKGQNHPKHVS